MKAIFRMPILNDKNIRKYLINKLNNQAIRPKALFEELSVHNGNAIADVVAVYNDTHCYEIKGDGDKIERCLKQGQYYNYAFGKITVVTTNRHLARAEKILPEFWGIMLAEENGEDISLKPIRKASLNKDFDKTRALLTLWKAEMLNIIEENSQNNIKNKSRKYLAQLISHTKKKQELRREISDSLISRFYQCSSGV